ncbi:hypothetical protein GCM10008955_42370 [Deinococcus malanensis]|uniref:Type III-B CRISPR module RAMP protein Cmr4 n=1 Tax=Deinococcus malanensis TaxID=1706855 RepID=A0ABQ2F3G3_9DEIO|nr:hypothetical protein GCM10008955_42370 [Deinococcus malanensis]
MKGVSVILTVTPIHVGEGDLSEDGLTTVRRVVQRHGGTLGVDARGGPASVVRTFGYAALCSMTCSNSTGVL